MTLYASDGSRNVSVVDGSTYTGIQANDGSYYVVVSPGTSHVGVNHPCGAYWVTVATNPQGVYAPDGSYNVSVSPYTNGGMRVTVISGSLTPGGTTATYYIYGF